jgi:hypothetical protein
MLPVLKAIKIPWRNIKSNPCYIPTDPAKSRTAPQSQTANKEKLLKEYCTYIPRPRPRKVLLKQGEGENHFSTTNMRDPRPFVAPLALRDLGEEGTMMGWTSTPDCLGEVLPFSLGEAMLFRRFRLPSSVALLPSAWTTMCSFAALP